MLKGKIIKRKNIFFLIPDKEYDDTKYVEVTDEKALKYFDLIKMKNNTKVQYKTNTYKRTQYYGGGDDDISSSYNVTEYIMICDQTGLEIYLGYNL